jgi:hypothetical protein
MCYIKETDVGSKPVSESKERYNLYTGMRPSASREASIVQIVRELQGDMKLSITISSRPRFVASDLRRGVGQSFVDILLAIKVVDESSC